MGSACHVTLDRIVGLHRQAKTIHRLEFSARIENQKAGRRVPTGLFCPDFACARCRAAMMTTLLDRHLHVGVGPAALEPAAALARVVVALRAQDVLARAPRTSPSSSSCRRSSIFGRCSLNVTSPGPRCLCHDCARRGMRPANGRVLALFLVHVVGDDHLERHRLADRAGQLVGDDRAAAPGRSCRSARTSAPAACCPRGVLERLDLVVLDQARPAPTPSCRWRRSSR